MTQYQRRYKVARALQMIAASDCKVSDDNVSDIYDDDDYIASPDVDSKNWRSCFWHYPEESNNDDVHTLDTLVKQNCGRKARGEKTWGNRERRGRGRVGRGRDGVKAEIEAEVMYMVVVHSQLHNQVSPPGPQAPETTTVVKENSQWTANVLTNTRTH